MSDTDAILAQSICEAIDLLVDELAADEATITTGMVLALGRRLAEQARTRDGARAGLQMVGEHLEAIVQIYMAQKLGH
jgi:hypothetical protein